MSTTSKWIVVLALSILGFVLLMWSKQYLPINSVCPLLSASPTSNFCWQGAIAPGLNFTLLLCAEMALIALYRVIAASLKR